MEQLLTANSFDKLFQYALFKSCTILRRDFNLCWNIFIFGDYCLCHISSSSCPASHFTNQLPHSSISAHWGQPVCGFIPGSLTPLACSPLGTPMDFLAFQLWGLSLVWSRLGEVNSCWWQQRWKPFSSGEGGLWGFCFVGFFKKKKLWRRQEIKRPNPEWPLAVWLYLVHPFEFSWGV